MKIFYACLSLMATLMMTGCAHSPAPSAPETLPPSLATPCPNLPAPEDGTGRAVLRWSIDVVTLYRECQSRHGRLVEAWQK